MIRPILRTYRDANGGLSSAFYELDPDLFWYLSLAIGVFVLCGFYALESGVEGAVKGAENAFYPAKEGRRNQKTGEI